MSNMRQSPDLRFLFCPWRDGPFRLTLHRHLIVKLGPKRIAIQALSHDEHSEEEALSEPLIYVDRSMLDQRGWVRVWSAPELGTANSCPLGKVFATEVAARSALNAWAHIVSHPGRTKVASLF